MCKRTVFVECPECEGLGEVQVGSAWVREYGHAPDHEDAVMGLCPTCNGTCYVEQEVDPIECDDLDEIPAPKEDA